MKVRKRSITTLQPSHCNSRHTQWLPRTRSLSTTLTLSTSGQFKRSDFGSQPFTGIYEPGGPTQGPLGETSNIGAVKVTPKMLKQHLDQYVVDQERAKKVLSTAVYNHYQRIQELERQEDEHAELMAQEARREMARRHPLEDEFPGQHTTTHQHTHAHSRTPSFTAAIPNISEASSSPTLEKSNILLLGPSGVGKTLMAKTLARILDVPFSMSDCTPLTSSGYIGEDVEIVIQRLLAASNYDVSRAEKGIIALDEIDKLSSVKVSHGKDVGGEGVQQALLKIVEGTTVTVQAKAEKTSATTGRERERSSGFPAQGPSSGGNASPAGKNEVYTVRTDNILFICTGAFIGLHKLVLERIAKGSIGFGAPVRAANPDSSHRGGHDTTIKVDSANADLFKKHLPFWNKLRPGASSPYTHSSTPPLQQPASESESEITLNTLDLVTPADLQKYGLIPELVGRIPITCAVSPLSEDALVRVLTEPRNALLKQYEALLALSNIELRFSTGAIREVAKKAVGMGTGARGLRGVLEAVLGESMFETPGSSTKYVLVTADVVKGNAAPIHLARGQGQLFQSLLVQEEDEFKGLLEREEDGACNFQGYRKKASATGLG